jgi:hypothetical protein
MGQAIPWEQKQKIAFFRGSRTSAERDPLVRIGPPPTSASACPASGRLPVLIASRSAVDFGGGGTGQKFPDLVEARYTKNQAWRSPADTLHMEPAPEVTSPSPSPTTTARSAPSSLPSCVQRFSNCAECRCIWRITASTVICSISVEWSVLAVTLPAPLSLASHNVMHGLRVSQAASFRHRHLFLCNSLVLHVGEEWLEFYYPNMKPWVSLFGSVVLRCVGRSADSPRVRCVLLRMQVHYIPVSADFSDAEELIRFVHANDALVRRVAQAGHDWVKQHLRMDDVANYWYVARCTAPLHLSVLR